MIETLWTILGALPIWLRLLRRFGLRDLRTLWEITKYRKAGSRGLEVLLGGLLLPMEELGAANAFYNELVDHALVVRPGNFAGLALHWHQRIVCSNLQNQSPNPFELPLLAAWDIHFNARALRLPSGRCAIVVNDRLLQVLITIAFLFTRLEERLIANGGSLDRPLADRLLEVARFLTNQRAELVSDEHFAEQLIAYPERDRFGEIASYMLLFILSHEYGHIYLHHLSDDPNLRGLAGLTKATTTRMEELQADHWGGLVLKKIVAEDARPAALHAVGLLFAFTMICERISPGWGSGSNSHPAPEERWEACCEALSGNDTKTAEDLVGIMVSMILDVLPS